MAEENALNDHDTEYLAAILPPDDTLNVCTPCVQSKQTRIIHHTPMKLTKRILERLHSDLWGAYDSSSLAGSSYAVILVDGYTKKSWVDFLKDKENFYDWFVCIISKLERLTDQKLAHLKADGGREYISHALLRWCKTKGVAIEQSTPYIPEHNAVSERN